MRVIVDGLNGCDLAANFRVNPLGKAAAGRKRTPPRPLQSVFRVAGARPLRYASSIQYSELGLMNRAIAGIKNPIAQSFSS